MDIQVAEIWDKIAGYCDSPYTLQQLSLVARFLRDISQSYLFQHLEHTAKYDKMPVTAVTGKVIERLYILRQDEASQRLQILGSSPAAKYVRSWKYEGDIVRSSSFGSIFSFQVLEAMSNCDKKLQEQFVNTLPNYSRLRNLDMAGLVLDDKLLFNIEQLTELETLDLSQLTVGTLDHPHRLKAVTLELKEKHGFNHDASVKEAAPFGCDPQYLRILSLAGRQILNPFLASAIRETNWPNLTTVGVVIDREAVPNFFQFLEGCQALTHLNVRRRLENGVVAAPYPPISQHACPGLYSVIGPAFLIEAIVPGRPVHEIEIVEFGQSGLDLTLQDFINALHSASQTTEDVDEFAISGGSVALYQDLLPKIGQCLPMLGELRVVIDDPQMELDDEEDEDEEDEDEDEDDGFDPDRMATSDDGYDYDNDDEYVTVLSVRDLNQGLPTVSEHFSEGYPRLMAQISLGLIKLPTTLVFLEITLTPGTPKNLSQAQQRAIMAEVSHNERFHDLGQLKMGIRGQSYEWENQLALESIDPNDPESWSTRDMSHGWIEVS